MEGRIREWLTGADEDVGLRSGLGMILQGICARYGRVVVIFFFQAEDGIRDLTVTGVQTCALPIYRVRGRPVWGILPVDCLLDHRGWGDLVHDRPSGSEAQSLLGIQVRRVGDRYHRSEERRVGKECRSRWSPYH